MKKIITLSVLAAMALSAAAQETYESATIADKDLNGTARYVGMGGAMEALGADISTISSNPAGLGMFRKSQVAGTAGLQMVPGSTTLDASKTTFSFDQIGFVYAMKSGDTSFLNFGFNYHKSKNFNQILSAANSLSGASQNKLSYLKGDLGVFEVDFDNNNNIIGWEPGSDYTSNAFSQVDYLYYNHLLYDGSSINYINADKFDQQRKQTGYISDFDFNISSNINNRVYLGLTLGVKDVRYRQESMYSEHLVADDGTQAYAQLYDNRRITGDGVDIKFGAIFRPVASSPFRIGAYVHTPTWYKLTTENTTYLKIASDISSPNTLYSVIKVNTTSGGSMSESYDFHLNTPWVFGLSLGHTIGTNIALGATYEYSKYSALDNRYIDGGSYDYYGYYQESSSSDYYMKQWTEQCLKGVHTLKVGAEIKVSPLMSVRLGYNYVSPKYDKENGYKDGTINSYGSFYASQTDYTNWGATNRLTCGLGFNFGKFSADLAYQYSQTNGEYFPFMSYYDNSDSSYDNICDVTKVSDKRHHILLTLGYRF